MRILILASVCAAGLCGCAQSVDGPLSPIFGKAVASMDTQIIPVAVSEEQPSSSGVIGVAAVGRYEKDQKKEVETQNTSKIGGASAGYGGGGGK
jgi:hypothetical protein